MSFLAPKIETRGLSQGTPGRIADWREAEVLPFGNGYFRVAPKWITDRFNDHWSNGSQTGQAFTSIAGWLCHGPVDRIRAIYNNGEIHLILEVVREPGQYYTEFTFGGVDKQLGVTNRGRIYWGLEDQPADAWLIEKTGQDHPPYPGICYIIFERLHLGEIRANTQAKPAIPNIEVSLSRLPTLGLPTDLRLPADVTVNPTSGVNWVSALYDALTHPRAGLDAASLLDTDQWEAAALAVQNATKTVSGRTGADAYISPLHTGRQEMEQVIADYLSYVDGFTFARNGLVAVDWFPNDGSSAGSLPEIAEADMSEDPEISDSTMADAPSTIIVKGLSDIDLEAAAEPYPVQLVRALHGDHRTVQLDRPWIVERIRLRMYGAQYAARALSPRASGRLTVFRSRAVRLDGSALRPGDQFRLLWPKQGRDLVCRVIEREEQELGAVVTLLFRSETGNVVNPIGPDDPDPYTPPSMGTYPCDDFDVYRAPSGLGDGAVVLARRSQPNYANLAVLIDPDGAWAGASQVLGQQAFAAQAALVGAISNTDDTLTIIGADEDVGPTLGSGMSSSEQVDNTMLLVIGDEWMSIGGVTSVDVDTYQIAVLRGRLGSTAAAHADTAVVRIIRRADLPVWNHALIDEGGTRSFKVKAIGGGGTESALSCNKEVSFPADSDVDLYDQLLLEWQNFLTFSCRRKGGIAELCGAPEFTDTSTPPKRYRKVTQTGTTYLCYYVADGLDDCGGAIPTVDTYDWDNSSPHTYDPNSCSLTVGQYTHYVKDGSDLPCVSDLSGTASVANWTVTAPGDAEEDLGGGSTLVRTKTTATVTHDGETCIDGGVTDGLIRHGSATQTLSDEDTAEDAINRLLSESEWSAWEEIGTEPLCPPEVCCLSVWEERTTGIEFTYFLAQWKLEGSGLPSEIELVVEIHLYRRPHGVGEFTHFQTLLYTAEASFLGSLNVEEDVPNEEGFDTYAALGAVYSVA